MHFSYFSAGSIRSGAEVAVSNVYGGFLYTTYGQQAILLPAGTYSVSALTGRYGGCVTSAENADDKINFYPGMGYHLGDRSILQLTEESLTPVSCLEQNAGSYPRAGNCHTPSPWQELDKVIHNYWESVTTADLMKHDPIGDDCVM